MRYVIALLFLFAVGAQAAPGEPYQIKNPAFAYAQKGDWVQGNPAAKVTVTEYASLSCSHCADFHLKVFPEIAKKYIETNKIQFIYRDFPLNAPALRASQALRCMPEEKRKDFLTKMYQTQNKWAVDEDYVMNLQSLAVDAGMSKKQFKKCLEDKVLEEALVKGRMDGTQQLNVNGTPSLYINGVRFEGKPDAEGVSAVIEKALAAQKP